MRALNIVLSIILCIGIVVMVFSHGLVADPTNLKIKEVTVDDYIIVNGFYYGGLYNYRSYRTEFTDGTLYIKYSGGIDLPWLQGRNSPSFLPVYNKHKNELERVYLSSLWNKEARLIWEKDSQ